MLALTCKFRLLAVASLIPQISEIGRLFKA